MQMYIFYCYGLVGSHLEIRHSINHQRLHDSLSLIPVQQTYQCILGIANFHCYSIALARYSVLIIFCCICSPRPQQLQHPEFYQQPLPNWMSTSSTCMNFTNYGDIVCGHTTIIVGIHNSTDLSVESFRFKTPPSNLPLCLNSFIWKNFNKLEYGISYGHEDDDFGKEPYMGFTTSLQSHRISISIPVGFKPLYFFHAGGLDTSILVGAMVILWDCLCPSFTSAPNCNIFQSHFGVKFFVDGKQYVRQFSPFEYTFCYHFMNSLCYHLLHWNNWYALDAGIPAMSSLWILDSLHDCLCQIRDSNFEIFQPNQFAAPAANIQAFINGAISMRMPNHAQWICALNADKELLLVRQLVNNPLLINNKSLHTINHNNFHLALWCSLIVVENDLLIYCEPISCTGLYAQLTIVPKEFYNVLFVAFHTNPAGSHLNSYCTLHHLRLHYYWPGMYS
jgi:hypothetical protein